MTPEQLVSIEIARVGILGTLLGTLLGILFGFISSILNRNWLREDELRKERLSNLNTHINEMETTLNNIIREIYELDNSIFTTINKQKEKPFSIDEQVAILNEITSKVYIITVKSMMLRDEKVDEIVKDILTKVRELTGFIRELHGNNVNEVLQKVANRRDAFNDATIICLDLFVRMNDFKLEELGLRPKSNKKPFWDFLKKGRKKADN